MKILLLALLVFAGCTTAHKKAATPPPSVPPEQQSQFDRGLKALDNQDYREAARVFEDLLLQKPGSQLDLVTLFNLGSAYEGMGECLKANERFRQVVRSSAGKFHKIESQALFRSSLMYECLGDDNKAITSLLDVRRRGKELPNEVLNAEIPARLAAAYARIGNRDKALEYFGMANHGLKSVVSAGGNRVQMELIARTLFLMGQLSPSQRNAEVAPDTYLQSLSMQQPYLLQAMELNFAPYSGKAAEDLRTGYENIFKFRLADAAAQREFYTRALQTSAELRKIRMPKPEQNEDPVFLLVDQTDRRLQTALSQTAETTPLTPAAQKREGLKRQGRLVNPSPAKDPTVK